jgi:hypothetical protein
VAALLGLILVSPNSWRSHAAAARWQKRSRKTSRIWRIDTLSAGISFPCCSAKERDYLRLKAVDDAGCYTLTSP